MGEAKRRKQLLGQGYWNPQTIGVYISKSHQTNKHMIWIGEGYVKETISKFTRLRRTTKSQQRGTGKLKYKRL